MWYTNICEIINRYYWLWMSNIIHPNSYATELCDGTFLVGHRLKVISETKCCARQYLNKSNLSPFVNLSIRQRICLWLQELPSPIITLRSISCWRWELVVRCMLANDVAWLSLLSLAKTPAMSPMCADAMTCDVLLQCKTTRAWDFLSRKWKWGPLLRLLPSRSVLVSLRFSVCLRLGPSWYLCLVPAT